MKVLRIFKKVKKVFRFIIIKILLFKKLRLFKKDLRYVINIYVNQDKVA